MGNECELVNELFSEIDGGRRLRLNTSPKGSFRLPTHWVSLSETQFVFLSASPNSCCHRIVSIGRVGLSFADHNALKHYEVIEEPVSLDVRRLIQFFQTDAHVFLHPWNVAGRPKHVLPAVLTLRVSTLLFAEPVLSESLVVNDIIVAGDISGEMQPLHDERSREVECTLSMSSTFSEIPLIRWAGLISLFFLRDIGKWPFLIGVVLMIVGVSVFPWIPLTGRDVAIMQIGFLLDGVVLFVVFREIDCPKANRAQPLPEPNVLPLSILT